MRAIIANICVDEVDSAVSGPEYYDFDVVISTLAFHHFNDVSLAIKRVVERLKRETGVLLIVDFRTHEPINHRHKEEHDNAKSKHMNFHDGVHTVTHSGFSEEEIKRWYEEAGLVDVDIVDVGPGTGITVAGGPNTDEVSKLKRAVFMAKGRRA